MKARDQKKGLKFICGRKELVHFEFDDDSMTATLIVATDDVPFLKRVPFKFTDDDEYTSI